MTRDPDAHKNGTTSRSAAYHAGHQPRQLYGRLLVRPRRPLLGTRVADGGHGSHPPIIRAFSDLTLYHVAAVSLAANAQYVAKMWAAWGRRSVYKTEAVSVRSQ